MMTEACMAICWSCGWTRKAGSRHRALEKLDNHGHSSQVAVLSYDDAETAEYVREGCEVYDPDTHYAISRDSMLKAQQFAGQLLSLLGGTAPVQGVDDD